MPGPSSRRPWGGYSLRPRHTLFSVCLLAGASLLAACGPVVLPLVGHLGREAPAEAPAPVVTRAQLARPTYTVQRATITDSIKTLGKVAGVQTSDLFFKTNGRLKALHVESGQDVKAGDLLAELETGDLATSIAKAQVDVQTAQLQLDQARAKTQVDATDTDRAAIEAAKTGLAQAQLQLDALRAGPTDADVKDLQAKLVQAKGNAGRARSDLAAKQADLAAAQAALAAKQAGPDPAALADAQAAVQAAQVHLNQVSAPPRPEDVQAAQLKLDQARTKLEQVKSAPAVAPEDVANAQLAVQKAMVALDQAKEDRTGSEEQRTARRQQAEVDLAAAQQHLQALQDDQNAPPDQWDVRAAELTADAAQNELDKLQHPSPYDVPLAKAQLDAAQAKLNLLTRGPTDEEIATLQGQIDSLQLAVGGAQAAVPSADAALAAAQAAYDAQQSGPNEFDVRDAEAKVALAQNALDQAQAKLGITQQTQQQGQTAADTQVQLLEKQLEQAQLVLGQYQSNLADAQIVAPFDGKVTRLNGIPGNNVAAYAPVVSVASADQLLVEVQVNDADIPRLAVGEKAQVAIDAVPGVVFSGTVHDLPSSVVTQDGAITDKTAKIAMDWTQPGADAGAQPGSGPALGMLARVEIVVQQKDGVLVVPNDAVKTVGQRRFVEYMDGNVKRSRSVTTGITTDTQTEIVTGLDEGTTILAGT